MSRSRMRTWCSAGCPATRCWAAACRSTRRRPMMRPRDLAATLSLPPAETALGILQVATANMVRAIRSISVERGHRPNDFALFAFGGAGPLHACDVARELEMSTIVVPPQPGLLCADGLLVSDLARDFVVSVVARLTPMPRRSWPRASDRLLERVTRLVRGAKTSRRRSRSALGGRASLRRAELRTLGSPDGSSASAARASLGLRRQFQAPARAKLWLRVRERADRDREPEGDGAWGASRARPRSIRPATTRAARSQTAPRSRSVRQVPLDTPIYSREPLAARPGDRRPGRRSSRSIRRPSCFPAISAVTDVHGNLVITLQ